MLKEVVQMMETKARIWDNEPRWRCQEQGRRQTGLSEIRRWRNTTKLDTQAPKQRGLYRACQAAQTKYQYLGWVQFAHGKGGLPWQA